MATNISKVKVDQKELITPGSIHRTFVPQYKNVLEGLQGGSYVVDEAFKDGDLELARNGWNIVNKNIFNITDFVKNILYSSKNRPLGYKPASPGQLVSDRQVPGKPPAGVI